jgi:type III secretory pathway component EscR
MFSNTIINLIITIIISFGIILSIQYLWNYIKDNYSTKRTKDLVNSQIEKYKKMLEKQSSQQQEFISEEQQETMKESLTKLINSQI